MTNSSPNFRVIRHEYKGDTWLSVHEVHYAEDGRPLRLVLPAAAMWQQFGPRWQVQSGFYRFEIPASMLGERGGMRAVYQSRITARELEQALLGLARRTRARFNLHVGQVWRQRLNLSRK